MQSKEHYQGDGFLEVQEVAGVTEERGVGGRSRNTQPVGFGRLNP